jgi:hypothetical protein
MTFRITVKQNPLEIEFEAGSLGEAVSILQAEDTAIRAMMALAPQLAGTTAAAEMPAAIETAPAETAKKRGRPAKEAPPVANAPPPAPVPATPPAPPTLPADGSIPPFLQRTADAPAPVAPPPPAPPPAPPAPVAVMPPALSLAPKVIAELKRRATGSADQGAGLLAWLYTTGLVVKGATWDESMAVLQFTDDGRIKATADALSVA